jgi:acetylornithine deacetylase/succinyl-diaminopimelate desuccinylase-like protein
VSAALALVALLAADGAALVKEPAVQRALEAARADEPRTLDDQARICEVAAPPFQEAKRAALYAQTFRELGLRAVRIDAVGNVLGERPGRGDGPRLVFSAHLDTVFPEGTDVRVRREGAVLKGPGIGDDCRGLAVVLGVIRALDAGKVETDGPITFVGTVGEEGLGDLRGVKHLFGTELRDRVDAFVSVDGTGLGITHIGVGSFRYRVTFEAPGGHSYGAFGLASPIHALGRAVARVADLAVPEKPKTTFNVGRIGGGTSVNSIAFEAWMEVDMRAADPTALQDVDGRFHQAVDEAVAAENARARRPGPVSARKERVGTRPAGRTPAESPIVRAAVSATEALGLPVKLAEGSTDSNVPMGLGIPAVTIDGGGKGTGAHAPGESFDSTDSWKGTQRALLLAIALGRK